MKKPFYALAISGDTARLEIMNEIGFWGVTAEAFLADLDQVKECKTIKLVINSPGGSVFDGISIFNMLSQYRDRLEVEVIGWAASIASIIALAGKKVTMYQGTLYMIHNPWGGATGTAEEIRKIADLLDTIRGQLVAIYQEKTGLEASKIIEMMDAETWMTGAEAQALGFVDDVINAKVAASADFDIHAMGYKKAPKIPQDMPETAPDNGENTPEAAAAPENTPQEPQNTVLVAQEGETMDPATLIPPINAAAAKKKFWPDAIKASTAVGAPNVTPQEISLPLVTGMVLQSDLLKAANVHISSSREIIPYFDIPAPQDGTEGTSAGSQTATLTPIPLGSKKLTSVIPVSDELIRSDADIDGTINAYLTKAFPATIENRIVTALIADATIAAAALAPTGSVTAITYAMLTDFVYGMSAAYRRDRTKLAMIVSTSFLKLVKKILDLNGNPVFDERTNTIMGAPYVESTSFAAYANGTVQAILVAAERLHVKLVEGIQFKSIPGIGLDTLVSDFYYDYGYEDYQAFRAFKATT